MTTTNAERAALRPPGTVSGARLATWTFLEPQAAGHGREQADTVVQVASELEPADVADADPRPRRQDGRMGWHVVNDLSPAAVVTRGPGGGKTVRALLPRRCAGPYRGLPRRRLRLITVTDPLMT